MQVLAGVRDSLREFQQELRHELREGILRTVRRQLASCCRHNPIGAGVMPVAQIVVGAGTERG